MFYVAQLFYTTDPTPSFLLIKVATQLTGHNTYIMKSWYVMKPQVQYETRVLAPSDSKEQIIAENPKLGQFKVEDFFMHPDSGYS